MLEGDDIADRMPDGQDASRLGALREELERRGLPIRLAFGENVLRVLAAQEGRLLR